VDLHGAIVLRVACCVKKMAAALASGTDFSAENQNPRSDPLRRRDRAARRSRMAEIRNTNTWQAKPVPHRFVFQLGISGFFRISDFGFRI
jgi:hypothetical protein